MSAGLSGAQPPAERRVLITGFDPFDGEPVNPSWEAARALEGWHCGVPGVTVHARRLPCIFGEGNRALGQALTEVQPELVLCVGQAGGRSEVSIERVAINLDDGRIADNAGRQPIDLPVEESGPAAYFATLPIKAIVRALVHAGIPASVSNTAGTFVCNHVFYGLMHRLATLPTRGGAALPRGGLIHIPLLPEQVARHPGQPSMALMTVIEALRIVIATALAIREDIRETAGRLH